MTEEKATDKQIAFMKTLGIKLTHPFEECTKQDAKELIKNKLEERDEVSGKVNAEVVRPGSFKEQYEAGGKKPNGTQRQIVRQSSLKSAINFCILKGFSEHTLKDVEQIADEFVRYVENGS